MQHTKVLHTPSSHGYMIISRFFVIMQHTHASDLDTENRHRRHRRDRDSSRKNGVNEELEDGELGEDGEIH